MSELKSHAIALSIAILGPLINLMIKPVYSIFDINPYLYWSISLGIYLSLLFLFTTKSLLTLTRLVFLGIPVEDFFSALWSSVFLGKGFLPFENWYEQYFPLGGLGEPTHLLLIPKWYLLFFLVYFVLTVLQSKIKRFQYKKESKKKA